MFRSTPIRRAVSILIAAIFSVPAFAYLPLGNTWPSGTVSMQLQLDATKPTNVSLPLTDGSVSWNALAATVLTDWNQQLGRTHFTSTTSPSTAAKYKDGDTANNVTFGDTVYGDAFGPGQLAITLSDTTPGRKSQADVIVNRAAYTWNSYRGVLRTPTFDLRRVLLHEFGHVLGLDHPDQAVPVQSVAAIMNSSVSNIEALQPDDIAGIAFLYSTAFQKPSITTQPVSKTVNFTENTRLSVALSGLSPVTPDVFHNYAWFYAATGSSNFEQLPAGADPTKLDFSYVQPTDAGRYYFAAITPDDTVTSDVVTLSVNPVTLSSTTQLANVASRGVAGSGTNSMIVGFNVTGSKPKKILLRGIGPELQTQFQVPGTLADPILTLRTLGGAFIATNNNWGQQEDATLTAADIRNASASVGAFALTEGSKDSVILVTLPPGSYTGIVSSPNNASGVVLLEAYDADSPLDPAIKLTNLSTRGFVGTGADIIIAGFVVKGPGPKTYLIRAVGPTLLDPPFNLAGSLTDTYLRLFSGGTLLRETDDWDSPAALRGTLREAANKVGAFPLREVRNNSGLDAVLLMTLPPGSYSAQMSGFESATGIGLIEVYEMPN